MSSPIIFEKGTRDFSTLGLGLLSDAIQATTTEELNGQFIFEMDYPVSGNNADLIRENRIIVVNSGHILKRQGFIIRQIVRKIDLTMTVYAEHVSYATLDVALAPMGTISGDAKTALENWKRMLVPAVDFTVDSDILTTNSTSIGAPEFETARQGLGGHAGSILDVWGGEYQFDNWHIRLLKQRGKSANAIIAYGRNLISFEQDTNIADTYTSVYPYYQENSGDDGNKTHFLPERTVDSEFVGKYPNPKVLMLDLSNKFKDVADYSETKLRNYALSYIQSNNIGVPKVNMKISTVNLSRATGGFSEDIDLGDTVNVYFEKLGITTSAKVIKAVWNVLSDDYDKFEIGARRSSLTESISELATTADENANKALNQALVALQSADGKSAIYYLNSSDPWPTNPNENDTAFVKDGENSIMYRYMFNNDTGVFSWVKILDSMSADQIKQRVSDALESGKAYSDQLVADNVAQVNAVLDDVQAKQADLTAQQAELDTKAQGYANKALADAKADTLATATQTAKTASDALATAKTDLTTSLNKEVTDRANAVTALDTKAKGYADTAKADAISAGATADGVINKKIDDTASSITSTISQNKTDTDGKITTAQSTATQALNGLATKVSQTVYDAKTGQLQTDLNTTTATANTSKQDIVAIKSDNTKQDARMTTIESDANGTKTTVSNLQTDLGKANGSISTLQQRADGFDATVTKVNSMGGINQLFNTEFSPDFAGWYHGSSTQSGKFQQGIVISPELGWSIGYGKHNGSTVLKRTLGSGYNAIYSELIPVGETQTITASIEAQSTSDFNGSVTAAIYLRFYDGSQNYISTLSKDTLRLTSWGRHIFTTTAPAGTVYVSFNLLTNGNAGVNYYSQPMLSFTDKAMDYVIGNYNNNQATAKAQLTADNAAVAISNYKTDADGRISKAQADIVVNANAIKTKVSQSDYDAKTGDLSTKVATAQTTADGAVSTIGAYKTSNDSRVASAESKITQNTNAITLRVLKTDYDANNGVINGKFTTINSSLNDITSSITETNVKVNNLQQVNLVTNSQLNIDYTGWRLGNPWGADVTNEIWNNGIAGNTGAMYVWHNQAVSNLWLFSEAVSIGTSQLISVSIDAAMPVGNKPASGTPLTLYLKAYDASKNQVSSFGYNIPLESLDGTFKTFKMEAKTLAASARYVSFVLGWNAGGAISFGRPMMVIGSTVGTYVPGQYTNNAKIAAQQITIDSITNTVSNPTTGLSVRVQTAEGTLSRVSGTDIPNLQKATFWQGPDGYDLNTYLSQGSYFFANTNARTNNPKADNGWMYLVVEQANGGSRVTQTAWYDSVASAKVTYKRQYVSGTWSPWYANDNDSVTSIAQTNGAIKTEISDRQKGDTNTLTQAKDFTTSSISNSESGMRSLITQTSDAIIAKIEATNLVTNSEFDPDNVGWYKLPADGSTIDVSGKVTTPIKSYYAEWDAVNGSRGMEFGATTGTWITSEPVRASSTGTYSISVLAGRPIAPATAVTMDFRLGLWDKDKKYITSVGSTNPLNGTTYLPLKYYKSENITVPSNTAFVSFVLGHSGSGTPDAIYHPMINHGATISPYTPTYGTTASSTVLSLLKDNWSIGIADNAGALASGIAGDLNGMTLISKKITLDGNTTVTGDFYAKGGNFKNLNASNITAGNLDADEVRIINLDVNTLTGDVSRFLETNWNGAYGSTKITSTGMKINTQYIQADFQGFGMDFSYSNKKIGGMGISQYLNGEPGLSMRLESNGAYMAWSARNEGDSTGSYIDKLAWYRQGKPALGGNYGFIFSDRVTFNKPINVEGASINLGFRPINLYGNNFPFFGNQDNITGFAYTSNEIYMVLQNQYVNLSNVIKALSGLGAWSVPTNIDSTGKVTQWRNVTT